MSKDSFEVMNLQTEDLQEIFDVNLKGESLSTGDLERIHMPSGKTHVWTIPGIEGDETTEEFTGIIVAWKKARSYWESDYTGGGEQPDCSSDDGEVGRGIPGGVCAECPLGQWSEDNNEPPECTEQRIVFILFPDNIIPYMLVLPPTSIVPLRRYFLRLSARGLKHYGVKTKFLLDPAENPGGIVYSKIKLEIAEKLDEEDTNKLSVYNKNITSLVALTPAAEGEVVIPDEKDLEFEEEKEPQTKTIEMTDIVNTSIGPEDFYDIDKEESEIASDADEFTPMDKFIEGKEPEYSFFWITTRSLGKTPDEVHKYFKVNSLTEIPKGSLDKYLRYLYKKVKGEDRYK